MASLRIPTTVTLNGNELDPKVFKVEHLPDFTIPERDRKTIHVEGRSGDIVIDGGSYKNVPRTYSISFGASGPEDFADKVSQISKWLDFGGYGELHDTYENDYYRLAYPSGAPKVKSILNGRMGEVDIDFSCMPKRFLMYGKDGFRWKSGLYEVTEPFLKGDVNGDGRISVIDAHLALQAAVGLITLDGSVNQSGTAAWAADYNSDGEIHSDDARLIVRRWAGLDGVPPNNMFWLWNPTDYESKPVIECHIPSNTVPGVCELCFAPKNETDLNKMTFVAVDLTGTEVRRFVIDCERETVYASGTFKNLNMKTVVSPGFPSIPALTEHAIEFAGSIDEIRVFPNFWVR